MMATGVVDLKDEPVLRLERSTLKTLPILYQAVAEAFVPSGKVEIIEDEK